MIDQFTKRDFEEALPVHKETLQPLWIHAGFIDGEYCYEVPIKEGVRIRIRSTLDYGGLAAPAGKDSIRMYLVDDKGRSLGTKVNKWTTRVHGWQERMKKVLRELFYLGRQLQTCPECNRRVSLCKVKNPLKQNHGRYFGKCWEHGLFHWVKSPPK